MESQGSKLKLYVLLLFTIMCMGTFVFAKVENLSFMDAFYFSIVTIATVGYGDIHPTTTLGKILAIGLIVAGVGTFLEVIAGLTQVMIKRREKEVRTEKLNMIIGLFFSELGGKLLRSLCAADPNRNAMAEKLSVSADWTDRQFQDKTRELAQASYRVDIEKATLEYMEKLLTAKGDLLLRLLENPMILEHETFTELLRAIFHFRDELMNRDQLEGLPNADKRHLAGDMERIYRLLVSHWLAYMSYLKKNYPYLFSLAMRTNPFDEGCTAVIAE